MTADAALYGGAAGIESAYTNLISNHTAFRDQENYRALLRGEDLPASAFSSFIHEATHHWCFVSPLGTTLSLLYQSAAKKALRWVTTGDESQTDEAFEDLRAFHVAVAWLRPLNEGLALFSEYDVRPSRSGPEFSPPLRASLRHLFNLQRRLAGKSDFDATTETYRLEEDIDRWRLSRQVVDRKSELLLLPVRSHANVYLRGYLTVKQLWRNAIRFYPQLAEADVFLNFLRRMVHGDYALVGTLLDRTQPGFQRGLMFGQQLYQRLQLIRLMLFAEETPWSEFERLLAPPTEEQIALGFDVADVRWSGLDTTEVVEAGRDAQLKLLREVAEPVDWSKLGLPFPVDYFRNVARERFLMWLGSVRARWRSTGPKKGQILVGDEVVLDHFKLTHASERGLDELTLDIYINLYDGNQFTAVSNVEHGVFAVAEHGSTTKRAPTELLKLRLDRRQITEMGSVLENVMRSFVETTNYGELLDAFWREGGTELLDDTYLGFAFDFNKRAADMVAEDGFAAALDYDEDLVRNVAAISLAASAKMSPESLMSMCSELTLDPMGTIQRLELLWPFADFPLVSIGPDGFLICIF